MERRKTNKNRITKERKEIRRGRGTFAENFGKEKQARQGYITQKLHQEKQTRQGYITQNYTIIPLPPRQSTLSLSQFASLSLSKTSLVVFCLSTSNGRLTTQHHPHHHKQFPLHISNPDIVSSETVALPSEPNAFRRFLRPPQTTVSDTITTRTTSSTQGQ